MIRDDPGLSRRMILAGLGAGMTLLALPGAARAQGLGRLLGLSRILGPASDAALTRLSRPNAFYDDQSVRIGLPMLGSAVSGGGGGLLGQLTGMASRMGLLDGLIHTLNDAAGVAAGEAKPIFRHAIDNLKVTDVPGILSTDTGATQYLRRSAGPELRTKMLPLVGGALSKLGAYRELDRLSARHSWLADVGITRQRLDGSVTDQGLDGIFKYMGDEERRIRSNPLGTMGPLLKGLGY